MQLFVKLLCKCYGLQSFLGRCSGGEPWESVSPLVRAILAIAADGERFPVGDYDVVTKVLQGTLQEMERSHPRQHVAKPRGIHRKNHVSQNISLGAASGFCLHNLIKCSSAFAICSGSSSLPGLPYEIRTAFQVGGSSCSCSRWSARCRSDCRFGCSRGCWRCCRRLEYGMGYRVPQLGRRSI